MYKNILFATDGTWENTVLTNQGVQIEARAIYLHLESTSFMDGRGSGTSEGVIVRDARLVVPQNDAAQQQIDDLIGQGRYQECYPLCQNVDIFPGTITFQKGAEQIQVSLEDPLLQPENFQFFVDIAGMEITDAFCRLFVKIDSISDEVELWYEYVVADNGIAQQTQLVKLL